MHLHVSSSAGTSQPPGNVACEFQQVSITQQLACKLIIQCIHWLSYSTSEHDAIYPAFAKHLTSTCCRGLQAAIKSSQAAR